MNKSDLVSRVAIDAGISKRDAAQAVDSVLGAVRSAVAKGEKVSLPGFGTFERRKRAARTARNPRTGETVKVAATSVPAFRPGQEFKSAVAGGGRSAGGRGGKSARGRRGR